MKKRIKAFDDTLWDMGGLDVEDYPMFFANDNITKHVYNVAFSPSDENFLDLKKEY